MLLHVMTLCCLRRMVGLHLRVMVSLGSWSMVSTRLQCGVVA